MGSGRLGFHPLRIKVTVAKVVTCPSPLPADEIQLYMNILYFVLLLSLYLHGFSSSWYPFHQK